MWQFTRGYCILLYPLGMKHCILTSLIQREGVHSNAHLLGGVPIAMFDYRSGKVDEHDGRGVTHVVYCMFPHGDGKQVWKLCWCGEAPQKFTGPVQARNPLEISWNYPNTRTLLANRQSGIVGFSWRLFNHFCPINLRSSGNQCPSQFRVLQCGAP